MQLNFFLSYTICKLKIFRKEISNMKKSLLGLSLVSLVALVGCGKQGSSTPLAEKAMKDIIGYLMENDKPEKGSGVAVKDGYFWDVYSDENTADYYLADEDSKDCWETCFYMFEFEKQSDGYHHESVPGRTFTLEELNNIGNNTIYDLLCDDEDFPVRNGKWACAEIYEPIEVDPDDDSTVSSYCAFYDCLDDKGDVDEDLLTLVIECFIFVRDFEDEESGKTLSLLFVDMYVENAKELSAA